MSKFFKKIPKIQVIDFDHLLYTQITGLSEDELNEDALFDKVCTELGLSNGYIYAMSYALNGTDAYIFLTLLENLDENNDFALPAPLIYTNLSNIKAQIPSEFALIFITQNYGYIAFYGGGVLLKLKNIPQFTLKNLKSKEKAQITAFIEDKVFEIAKFKASCAKFGTKKLVFIGDELGLAEIFKERVNLPFIILNKFTPNPQNLALSSIKMTSNFLRHKIQTNFIKRLIFGFFAAFFLGFCVILGYAGFEKYKFESSFGENILNLEDLQSKNSKNAENIEEISEILAQLEKDFTPFDVMNALKSLFELCFEHHIKLKSMEISPSQIKIIIANDEKSALFIKNLYSNDKFSLKNSENLGDLQELILEQR